MFINDIPLSMLDEYQAVVDRALKASLDLPLDSQLPLYRMMRHQLGWIDQQGEDTETIVDTALGALCMEAADASGPAALSAPAAAAAMVLLSHSIEVHEDMQAAQQSRDDRDAVWWVWGPAQAINVGDGLHALARLSLFRMAGDALPAPAMFAALETLDQAALEYYEGQFLDLQMQERIDVTLDEYRKMASNKFGSLVGGSLAMGRSVSGASASEVAVWKQAGRAFGLAASISDDTRVFWSDQSQTGRALNKSKLYPVVLALEAGSLADKRELSGFYFKRIMESTDLASIRAILDRLGVWEAGIEAAETARTFGLECLERAGLTEEGLTKWDSITAALVKIAK